MESVPDKIRPELSIEKWPAIWRPARSKHEPEVRLLRRQISRPDGSTKSATVEVGFTHLGNLTTEDQKTYYALTKLWEENGRPQEFTYFSIRRLARTLGKRWGTDVIKATTESLRRLRTTPFVWTNSYRDGATKQEIEVLDTFTILSDLKIIRAQTDGHVTRQAGFFCFDNKILQNLMCNHTKPLRWDIVLRIRGEIAQLLYTHIDLILASHDLYERRTKKLFADLGLDAVVYRSASERKRTIEKALDKLRGVPISSGVLTSASIQRTRDGKDYKVVFRKTRSASFGVHEAAQLSGDFDERPNLPAGGDTPLQAQARDLVIYFHQLFGRSQVSQPRHKEIVQATGLIARNGIELARYIVTFSRHAADRTNFSPVVFGGILHYEHEALRERDYYNRLAQIGRKQVEKQKEEERNAEVETMRVEIILKSLPEAQYRELYEMYKKDFESRFPSIVAYKPNIFDGAIKAKIAASVNDPYVFPVDNENRSMTSR